MAIRDLGRQVLPVLEKISTAYNTVQKVSSLVEGFAAVATQDFSRAADPIQNGKSSITPPPNKFSLQGKKLNSVISNPLEQYASFSPLWTLACLETAEFNKPDKYRKSGKLKHVVFSSGGRYDSDRVRLAGGAAPEYFIENFKMSALISPTKRAGNTNAFKFEFQVFEPYSMGLFLQSLQVAARKGNYTTYLVAPFVLKLDFLGYNDLGQVLKPTAKGAVRSKFFVMKITNITFNVTESGSNYQVEAIPFNHQAFSDANVTLYNDIKISSPEFGTVEEALRSGKESLIAALNKVELNLKASGKIGVPDQFDIQFPETASDFAPADSPPPSATSAVQNVGSTPPKTVGGASANEISLPPSPVNEIGQADFGFDQGDGGNYPYAKEDAQRDPETGIVKVENLTIDPKNRSFQFSQGQSIVQIINTTIVNSSYVYNSLKPENKKDGNIKHFMIDIQMEFLGLDPVRGEYAKKTTYRVVPYLVHEAIFMNPNAAPPGYPALEKKITKAYNYIYTGQNTDILKFDIQINNLFFQGMQANPEKNNPNTRDNDRGGIAEQQHQNVQTGTGSSPAAQLSNIGRPDISKDPSLLATPTGGPGHTSIETQVAESFHNAFIKGTSVDLVKVNLEILGDPYWLVDHGIANHFSAAESPTAMITEDQTMNYTSGSVYIYISFRTPYDINEITGEYDYQSQIKESPFSGIYRVVKCENMFSGGNFTQTLECLRQIGQALDFKDNPSVLQEQTITPTNNGVVEESDPVEPRTTPFEDTNIQVA